MKMLRGLLVLAMGMSSLAAMGQQMPLVRAPSVVQPLPSQALSAQVLPGLFASNRGVILQLIETLLHIPYVVTVDSMSPMAIKTSAALAFIGNDFRVIQQLLTSRQDASALRVLLAAAPKVLGYLLAAWYDMARFDQADRIAEDNKNDAKFLRQFKANQAVLLAFEVVLRILVVVAGHSGLTHDSWVPWGIVQVADWVGLWRLISRYFTILLLLERFELAVVTQPRLQVASTKAVVLDKNEMVANDLAEFAERVQLPLRVDGGVTP